MFLSILTCVGTLASYNSSFQTTLVKQFIKSLSQKLGNNISVGNVDVSLFNKLILTDFYVEDLHKDTLFYSKLLIVDIKELTFKKKRIILKGAELNDTYFNLKKYEKEKGTNLSFIINHFTTTDTTKSNWVFEINNLKLNNSRFNYDNENVESRLEGVDYYNIAMSNIDLSLSKIKLVNKGVDCKIDHLNFYEKSGFKLDSLSTEANITPSGIIAQNLKIKTPHSDIDGNITFLTNTYTDLKKFVNDVNIKSFFKNSKLSFKDIYYFAPSLKGLKKSLSFKGEIKGKITSLKGRNLSILLDDGTRFKGDADLSGLPDAESMFMYIKVKELITSKSKLESIPMYPFTSGKHIKLPENFKHLGTIRFRGNYTGFYHDFVTYGKIETSLGVLTTDVSLKLNKKATLYKGNLLTEKFDLGKLFDMQGSIGNIAMNVNVDGQGFSKKNVNTTLTGDIKQITIKDYEYNNVKVKGNFKDQIFAGFLAVKDENISFDFDGKVDLSKEIPEINFVSNIEGAKLAKLNFITSKKKLKTRFSTHLKVNLLGATPDDFVGTVEMVNSRYNDKLDSIKIDNIIVESKKEDEYKKITIKSDALDANVEGKFKFSELASYFDSFMLRYIPSQNKEEIEISQLPSDVTFKVQLHHSEIISKLFLKGIGISNNAKLVGNYKAQQDELELIYNSSFIDFYGTEVRGVNLKAIAAHDSLRLTVNANKIHQNDSLYIDNFSVSNVLKNDSGLTYLKWKNQFISSKNEGEITLKTKFDGYEYFSSKIVKSKVYISDSLWRINPLNEIIVDSTGVLVNDFSINSANQGVIINGMLSNTSNKQLNIHLKELDLLTFKRVIPKKVISLEGVVNGSAAIKIENKELIISSNIAFNQFKINSHLVGDGIVQSEWNTVEEFLKLDGNFYRSKKPTISFKGFYYPYKAEENLAIDLALKQSELSMFDNYTHTFLEDLQGTVDADVSLTGSFIEPSLNGKITLKNTEFKVIYLNTAYRTKFCEINLIPDMISFDNVEFLDERGNKGKANGTVFHTWFSDWSLGVGLDVKNFLALNTTEENNNIYYGRAYVSGLIDVSGYDNQLVIDVNVKTDKNTILNIPLDDSEDLEENNFIEFITNDTTEVVLVEDLDLSNIEMNFDLEITPEAQIRLIFDDQIGDVIKSRGNGRINMKITNDGDLNMFGNYVVKDGDYLFTLQNVINKKFDLEEGGTISWNGSAYDAEINLTAVYRTRARLFDLLSNIDSNDIYKKRIPVDLKLKMSNKMMNPDISFDIGLPTADGDTKSKVRSVLYVSGDQENIQELNKQVFSLLVLNSFLPPSGTESSYGRASVQSTTSSELLSNQVSNWLSRLSNDVDIGLNYTPGDELSNQEVELALSTQFFNDRLIVDGNFGLSDRQDESNQTQNTNNLIGDISVEYKITRDGKLRVKVFNNSNQFSLTETNSSYTQGLGFSYREEYDTNKQFWRSLFNRFRKKTNRKPL